MLNIKSFILAVLVISLSTACTDYLEEPTPAQSLPSDAAFATASDLQTALNGAYDALQQSDFGATGVSINSSVLSDDGRWEGSFPSYIDMYNRQLTSDNGEVTGLWRFAYLAINHANLVIRGVQESDDPELTTEVGDALRGQALFIRGYAYFELARYFGLPYGPNSSSDPAVPIVTDPVAVSGDITFPTRNSVEEVYNQAISDLTAAQGLLEPTSDIGIANSTAATGILAEIAFQQRNYQRAADLAGQVINTAGYSLTPEPQTPFFSEGSAEEIFSVVSTTQDNPGVNGSLATFHHRNGRGGDVKVSTDLYQNGYLAIISDEDAAAAEANGDSLIDLRAANLIFVMGDVVFVEKYDDFANNGDDNIISRLATYYLMRAEALARINGVNEESIELLNAIRSRAIRSQGADGSLSDAGDLATYEEDDFDSADELIEAIILERRVELAFEPYRVHDLKRLMRDIRGLAYDDPKLVFPIPQRELDANTMLQQNPTY